MGFITIQGENQIAAKQGAGETLNITGFVLANIDGLGAEPVNRVASLPAPADIMDELNVTKFGYVNTNQVVYSLVMDSSIGDYDFNWVGLVDDEGVLIAVTHTPLIQKRATSGGVPGNNLTRNFLIAYSGIQATTAIAVPAETWQIDFNARLHGIDERERLSNFDIYGDASFIGDGFKIVREGSTTTYNSLAGIGYVGGIRIASAVAQPITVASGPNSIWADVSLQGDISDVSPVVDFIVSNVAQANYTDPNGFKHYLTKLCEVAAGGAVTDTRISSDQIEEHLNDPDPHPQYLTEEEADDLYAPIGSVSKLIARIQSSAIFVINSSVGVYKNYPALSYTVTENGEYQVVCSLSLFQLSFSSADLFLTAELLVGGIVVDVISQDVAANSAESYYVQLRYVGDISDDDVVEVRFKKSYSTEAYVNAVLTSISNPDSQLSTMEIIKL